MLLFSFSAVALGGLAVATRRRKEGKSVISVRSSSTESVGSSRFLAMAVLVSATSLVNSDEVDLGIAVKPSGNRTTSV